MRVLRHESAFTPDGRTLYSASPGTSTIQAVSLDALPLMTPIWTSLDYDSHGLSVSDEFGAGSKVGAGRIIDIGDETQPEIISNLRLEVHQPEHFAGGAVPRVFIVTTAIGGLLLLWALRGTRARI